MPVFLDLPPELAIRVFCYLSLSDLSACQLTHSSLRTLINNSILVQYHIATQAAGVEDNPELKLSIHDRLERLNSQEDGWARLDFDFSKTVPVVHDPSGIYDLTGGIYLLGNASRRALHYCTLPSKASDETRWSRIDVDASIIDLGLGVYEHDLVAVITTTRQDVTSHMHNLEIVLLKLSTGEPHPEARLPRIFVGESRWARPAIGIEIVGDTLALVTTCYQNPFNLSDNFYLFDWKTGALKLHATAPNNSYAGLLFLSPTLLLLPNSTTNTLEFWDSASAHPIGALGLPDLNDDYTITGINCRCEPNPVAEGTPHSAQPFHAVPDDAIAIFNIRILAIDGPLLGTSFSMFVHRRTLLGLCPARRRDGDGKFDIIPWETWGPDATRWLNADIVSARWITTTAGARAAVMVENVGAVVIMDFHPARLHARRREQEQGRKRGLHMWVEDGELAIVHPAFEERVVSRLPYAARMLARAETYEGLLMDEERLIGLQTDDFGSRIREIVIHHLGTAQAGSSAGGENGSRGAEALSINEID